MKRFLLTLALVFLMVGTLNATTIDLRTWTQEGDPAYGTWTVASDGSSVFQTENGHPTYFVSDTSYINNKFDGSFEVRTTVDDDFIGFVFGWNSITDYYLVDWKQNDQYSSGVLAPEGFTLSRITGTDAKHWGHTGNDLEVLDTDYGGTRGWADNTEYAFTLDYTETEFTIAIDSVQIFNETGAFSAGKFGFYNNSQSKVFYQGFEEENSPPDPVPEPCTMFLLGSGLLGLVSIKRKKS